MEIDRIHYFYSYVFICRLVRVIHIITYSSIRNYRKALELKSS